MHFQYSSFYYSFNFRNRGNDGKKKRYLKAPFKGVVEKLGRKTIPDFNSLKNQGKLLSLSNIINY